MIIVMNDTIVGLAGRQEQASKRGVDNNYLLLQLQCGN